MKIIKHKISPIFAIALIVASGCAMLNLSVLRQYKASAYTSAENTLSPAVAPDSFVVTIPDANFKSALNAAISAKSGLVRSATQNITFGEMKTLTGLIAESTFSNKNIINLEGAQFLQNATILYFNNNQISNVAPLSGLQNAQRFYLRNNKITDFSSLSSLNNLQRLDLYGNVNLNSISPVENLTNLVELNIGKTSVNNISPLTGKNKLQYLHIDGMQNSAKPDLAPISNLAVLLSLNIGHTRYTADEISVIKNISSLTRLNISGNRIYDIQSALSGGFTGLVGVGSTFSEQRHSIQVTTKLFANPIRGINGETIPVIETTSIKNADANGTLNPNGEYIKILTDQDSGIIDVNWSKNFIYGNFTAERPFSGALTINYDIDSVAPIFSPVAPAKIISRKNTPIALDDVSASDNIALNADGVTNNALALGLDATNPSAGMYIVTYSATDTSNNTSTVEREVEITDSDKLEQLLSTVSVDLFKGKTPQSISTVENLKNAAASVVANLSSTQAEIDEAYNNLYQAILNLQDIPAQPAQPETEATEIKAPRTGLGSQDNVLAVVALLSVGLIVMAPQIISKMKKL